MEKSEKLFDAGELAMIKSLLEPDEKQPEEIKIETKEKTASDLADDENFEAYFVGIESLSSDASEPENLSEITEPADDALIFSKKPEETMPAQPPAATTGETFDFSEPHFNQPENSFAETINYEPLAETADERINNEPLAGFPNDEINFDLPAQAKAERPEFENSGLLFQPPAKAESFAETARNSGLAYAAAITLFGSIVFMLIIGWFADLLFGSSPWGIVGGIVLGAAIGFFQFFRLTSQIFKK